jgi:hypothetical protein
MNEWFFLEISNTWASPAAVRSPPAQKRWPPHLSPSVHAAAHLQRPLLRSYLHRLLRQMMEQLAEDGNKLKIDTVKISNHHLLLLSVHLGGCLGLLFHLHVSEFRLQASHGPLLQKVQVGLVEFADKMGHVLRVHNFNGFHLVSLKF